MFDVLPRTLQQALYSLLQQVAQVGWTIDQSLLYIIHLLDQWRRMLVERGFTTALDHVATDILGLSRPMLNLVLVLGCLLVMLAPITAFRWVNVRKAVLLAVLLPIALPWVAANVQQIDAARGDLASSLYNSIFADSQGDFAVGDGGTGQAQQMGPLVPYAPRDDGREGLRGLDVAAAYVYATKADVDSGAELPVGFRQVYFAETVESLGEKENAERWLIVQGAGSGVTRTLYALLPLLVALFEGLTNLALSVALGFTLLTAMLATLFAFLTPFEGFLIGAIRRLAELFLQSWAISTMQALSIAALIDVATSGSAIAVLGMGCVVLLLQSLYTVMAFKAMWAGISGIGGGGGIGTSFKQAVNPLRSVAGTVGGAAVGGLVGAGATMAAVGMARGAGASWRYAAGYAASATRAGRGLGALATAMGGDPTASDAGRGLLTGAIAGRGAPTSLRAMQAVRHELRRSGASPTHPAAATAGAAHGQPSALPRPSRDSGASVRPAPIVVPPPVTPTRALTPTPTLPDREPPVVEPPAPAAPRAEQAASPLEAAPILRHPTPASGLVLPPSVATRIPTPDHPFIVPTTARRPAPPPSDSKE